MAAKVWATREAIVQCIYLISKTGENHIVAVDTSKGHSAMDYNEHNRTYAGFLTLTKYAIIFLVLLLAGMKFFLV
jgi:Bacterial aa3 type cytochrome c oxidase subunit IV